MPERVFTYDFRGRFGNLTAGLTTAGRNVDEFGNKLVALDRNGAKMRAGLNQLGSMGGRMAVSLGAGLAFVAKTAVDWESAWAGVMKTVDGTSSQLSELEDDLRELARTMPATHQEIAATAEAAGQLGVAREDVADFTKIMIELGETTNMAADDAATSIAQFMNVLGTAPDKVDEIGNTLVDLGNKGASTESQILDMAQRLSGIGTTIGASEADILGLAAAMANLGIESELGGGAIQRVMVGINTQVASSGKRLQDYADLAGMTAEEFATAWRESPVEAFDALLKGLGGVRQSGGDVAAVLDSLGIKGTQNLQVMLRLAGAGDELTNALDQSGAAWEENSALFVEFGKRAGTTAAEMQVAWNNIKDAAIDAGAAMLPILSKAADGASLAASAFNGLPGPLQNTATGMAAVAAIAGGGLWFGSKVVQGVADTRQALADLGLTADRTGFSLGRMARTGARIAGLAGSVALLGEAIAQASGAKIDVSDLQRDLEALANGQNEEMLSRITNDIAIMSDVTGKLTEPLKELTVGLFTLNQVDTNLDNAQKNIANVDEALASMVESGNGELAAEIFEKIAASVTGLPEGSSFNPDLITGFDSYATALGNAGDEAEETDQAVQGLTSAQRKGIEPTEQLTAAQEKQAAALKKAREDARDQASAFLGLGDSLNDAKVSLGSWISDLQKQADALKNFRVNAEEAANKGLRKGLIEALADAGPEGALRMKQLADATDKEIARANQAWISQRREMKKWTDFKVPPKKTDLDTTDAERKRAALMEHLIQLDRFKAAPWVAMQTGQAMSALASVRAELERLDGKKATVSVVTQRWTLGRREDVADAHGADGLTVPGQRWPYGDKTLVHAAPGEEIVSNRHGGADKNRSALKAASLGAKLAVVGYATGGTVGKAPDDKRAVGSATFAFGEGWGPMPKSLGATVAALKDMRKQIVHLNAEVRESAKEIKEETRERDRAQKRVERAQAEVDRLTGLYSALSSTIAEGLAANQFATVAGVTVNPWQSNTPSTEDRAPTIDEIFARLDESTANANAMTAATNALAANGLSGDALRSVLEQGLGTAQMFANLTPEQLAAYQNKYDTNAAAIQEAGTAGGQAVYGEDMAKANAILAAHTAELERQTTELRAANQAHRLAERQRDQTNRLIERVEDRLKELRDDRKKDREDAQKGARDRR